MAHALADKLEINVRVDLAQQVILRHQLFEGDISSACWRGDRAFSMSATHKKSAAIN
jgi:hypothetical protein